MVNHSNILAWRIPRTEEPGRLQSIQSQRVRHNWATFTHSVTHSYFPHLSVPAEKATAPHSSTLAWKIPWTEEPGRLQSLGLLRVGHDWVTSLSLFTFMRWRRKWQPTPVLLPGESQGRKPGGLLSYGVAQSQTRLQWCSSSSSSSSVPDNHFHFYECDFYLFIYF